MGIEYILVLEKEIGVSADIFPTLLLKNEEVFAPILAEKRLPSFQVFERRRSHQWFDPADGLQTVHSCLDFLRSHPDYVVTQEKQQELFKQHVQQEARRYYENLSSYHQMCIRPLTAFLYHPPMQPSSSDSTPYFIEALEIVEEVLVAAKQHRIGFYFWTTMDEANEEEDWRISDSYDLGHTRFSSLYGNDQDDSDEGDACIEVNDEYMDMGEQEPHLPPPGDEVDPESTSGEYREGW